METLSLNLQKITLLSPLYTPHFRKFRPQTTAPMRPPPAPQ